MRSLPFVALGVAALAASIFALGAEAGPPWGPETPSFNIEVILRDVAGGSGFGHVKFRQPSDTDKIVYLDTWVRDLAPNHARAAALSRSWDSGSRPARPDAYDAKMPTSCAQQSRSTTMSRH